MLSDDQLAFFARNGFLVIKGMADADTCDRLVDHTWTRLPPNWGRDAPATWTGTITDSCHTADIKQRRGHTQYKKGDLIGHPVIEGAFSTRSRGGDIGRALIGHSLAPMRIRGLYAIVPVPAQMSFSPIVKPHIESHPCMLVSLCYLADVAPGGGGLLVWPGSHRAIYPKMGSKLEHVATPESEETFRQWARLQPIELPGQRGDAVIIHHRLMHAPSINRSSRIRFAFLCDYQRDDFKELCTQLPKGDLWEDWPAISRLPDPVRNAPSDYVLQPQAGVLAREIAQSSPEAMSVAQGTDTTPANIRKADASTLARARRDGDIWLAISDDPVTRNDTEIFPRGSDLSKAGMQIRLDDEPVASLCKYDFINRLALKPGGHSITVDGLDRPVWLRILRIKLPFRETEFVARQALRPGRPSRIEFTVPS